MNHEADLAYSLGEVSAAAIEEAAPGPPARAASLSHRPNEAYCAGASGAGASGAGVSAGGGGGGGGVSAVGVPALPSTQLIKVPSYLQSCRFGLNHDKDGGNHNQNEKNSHSGTLPFAPA